jgi:hypothetical protein
MALSFQPGSKASLSWAYMFPFPVQFSICICAFVTLVPMILNCNIWQTEDQGLLGAHWCWVLGPSSALKLGSFLLLLQGCLLDKCIFITCSGAQILWCWLWP